MRFGMRPVTPPECPVPPNQHLIDTAVLEREAVHQACTAMTEGHLEASRAFAEKRRPVFRGR
jgi:hypothetical protein